MGLYSTYIRARNRKPCTPSTPPAPHPCAEVRLFLVTWTGGNDPAPLLTFLFDRWPDWPLDTTSSLTRLHYRHCLRRRWTIPLRLFPHFHRRFGLISCTGRPRYGHIGRSSLALALLSIRTIHHRRVVGIDIGHWAVSVDPKGNTFRLGNVFLGGCRSRRHLVSHLREHRRGLGERGACCLSLCLLL